MANLPTSIATVSLSGTLPEKLEAAAAAGFDGIELFENDLLTWDGTPAELRGIAEGLGLAIMLYQPFRDFEGLPEPLRARAFDRVQRKFDVMAALGADRLLMCSSIHPQAMGDAGRAAADLRELAELAGPRGITLGYEALAWGRHVNRWRQAWAIVREADHPALGIVLDSFHTLALGDTLDGLEEVPGEKIAFLQLADAPLLGMDALAWSRHFRLFPGQGDWDVAGFARRVVAAGYRGPLSLEVFNDHFRAAPARGIAIDGLRSLRLVAAEAGLAELPAAPAIAGVAFIEFAVDTASGAALGGMLGGLGFRRVGLHRSKQVELWRRGEANIVLNGEPDSMAAEHFHLHGPSVCAMALAVDDAARTLARAEALLAPRWRERLGPGERPIPAIRAPDGTLIYLVEPDPSGRSHWEDDFHLAPAPAEAGVRFDHVAVALPDGRMETFILFWRALFGLRAEPLVELADPYGLVRSRAMRSADGALRLPLNVSESRETGTGRFVTAAAGAGVQHIALAVPDIRGERQRAGGFLPIPGNYYDDLEARFGLEPDAVAALRAGRLLYDQDEGGTFRQAYTARFEELVFFELCERRGYEGYGAANAGVRLAAQAAHAAMPGEL
jgi:4-hydroxyphenylpyruvate dioxygenase